MRYFAFVLILTFAVAASGQSRRVAPSATPAAAESTAAAPDLSVRQMYDEANGYMRAKFEEYERRKVPYTDVLAERTKLEQRQLAARYAAAAALRRDLAGDDLYYAGMLNWIAENLDGTVEWLRRFVAGEAASPERTQTARSVMVVASAKQNKMSEAEAGLAEYSANEPRRLTERARMGAEIAKRYQQRREFAKMLPHAVTAYESAKTLLADATSRARGLDEILDAAMLVFEAQRDLGERERAEAALDDLRRTAAEAASSSLYYYAVDKKIRYLIDTGRKPLALEYQKASITTAIRELADKSAQAAVTDRLKRREKHYKLLGAAAPELPAYDQWFPGTPRTLASMKGKVVLLDFWATWCGPCFEAFPSLVEWHRDHKADGLEILGITRYYGEANGMSADEASELAFLKNFRQRHGLPYDFVVARGQAIQLLYGATSLPTHVLIDRKGVVRYVETGTSPGRIAELREELLRLLEEK